MLSLRKNSQHINEDVCKWIPLPSLKEKWTDKKVFEYFKLSKKQIDLINGTIIVGFNDTDKKKKSNSKKKAVENKEKPKSTLKKDIDV